MTDHERDQAIKEAERNQSGVSYFQPRSFYRITNQQAFDAGFDRGWDAATAPLLGRIAALEAKLAQRVPEWNGLVEGERNQIVNAICEYGTGFVTPLYAIVAGIERKLMERNAAPAAPEQQEPTDSMGTPVSCGKPLCSPGDHHPLCAQAPNAQQAEAQEPCQSMCETPCTKRKPLTIAEVEAILARWSYELHGDRARFIVRETELAHGIGAAAAMAPEEAE